MAVGKLYMIDLSPPCRAVLLTAKALGIQVDQVYVNLMKGDHLTPEFLKMNPQHAVPTYLDQDGTAIGDSHAIMAFLVGKYGKNDKLYPKSLSLRAKVDQRLHFDSGNTYATHLSIVNPMWMKQECGPNERQLKTANTMYEILNNFLAGNQWVAGTDCYTIADLSLVTSIMAICVVAPMDHKKYPNIPLWIQRCQSIPFFKEINAKGHNEYEHVLKCMLANNYEFMKNYTK